MTPALKRRKELRRRPHNGSKTLVVLAHPDDETIGTTKLLGSVDDVVLIHATDGAPRKLDSRPHGFARGEHYALTRAEELRAAMALIGVPAARLVSFGIPDQGAAFSIAEIAERLQPLFDGIDIVVTHAYEGGHPDHDAVALAVHCARARIERRIAAPEILEIPLYHAGPTGWIRQRFVPSTGPPASKLLLSPREQDLKKRMFRAYASQSETLQYFHTCAESYRIAPRYDFGKLPNNGALLYERYEWGMSRDRWQELAEAARARLDVEWPV